MEPYEIIEPRTLADAENVAENLAANAQPSDALNEDFIDSNEILEVRPTTVSVYEDPANPSADLNAEISAKLFAPQITDNVVAVIPVVDRDVDPVVPRTEFDVRIGGNHYKNPG